MIELQSCDVTTEEQETTISYGRRDDRATVYTNDTTVLTKIQKLLNAEGSTWKLENTYYTAEHKPSGYQFTCPKKMIKFLAKSKAVSEEQREALRQRMADYRASLAEGEEE